MTRPTDPESAGEDVPDDVAVLIGEPQYHQTATFAVERAFTDNTLCSDSELQPFVLGRRDSG
ncbi:MAG: hypothetical protein M5U19_10315 [Microthrixaceae bacterium]|nr:hypothetical protein [Microthrixaceae bacterium]